jgi:hypothetical protein
MGKLGKENCMDPRHGQQDGWITLAEAWREGNQLRKGIFKCPVRFRS